MDDEQAIGKIAGYVSANLGGDLSCEALARHACMGRTKFKQLFKQAYGRPPAAFVADARIERARFLLETTDLPIAEIAAQVGYRKPGAFSEAFRRRTAVLPSAVRKAADPLASPPAGRPDRNARASGSAPQAGLPSLCALPPARFAPRYTR